MLILSHTSLYPYPHAPLLYLLEPLDLGYTCILVQYILCTWPVLSLWVYKESSLSNPQGTTSKLNLTASPACSSFASDFWR